MEGVIPRLRLLGQKNATETTKKERAEPVGGRSRGENETVSDKNKWISQHRKSTLGLKMKRMIPRAPSTPPLPIPWSPSSYGRPTDIVSYHRDTVEFDATESMSFVKYILATNSSSRRLRCSRHRNGYIVVVRLAATRFTEIPENRGSRIAA